MVLIAHNEFDKPADDGDGVWSAAVALMTVVRVKSKYLPSGARENTRPSRSPEVVNGLRLPLEIRINQALPADKYESVPVIGMAVKVFCAPTMMISARGCLTLTRRTMARETCTPFSNTVR